MASSFLSRDLFFSFEGRLSELLPSTFSLTTNTPHSASARLGFSFFLSFPFPRKKTPPQPPLSPELPHSSLLILAIVFFSLFPFFKFPVDRFSTLERLSTSYFGVSFSLLFGCWRTAGVYFNFSPSGSSPVTSSL